MADIEAKVQKCKDYILADLDDTKLLYVLKKLSQLDITIDILQSTGIGKIVNTLRKRDGTVAEKAKQIVHKWKEMVSAEAARLQEEEERTNLKEDSHSEAEYSASENVEQDSEGEHSANENVDYQSEAEHSASEHTGHQSEAEHSASEHEVCKSEVEDSSNENQGYDSHFEEEDLSVSKHSIHSGYAEDRFSENSHNNSDQSDSELKVMQHKHKHNTSGTDRKCHKYTNSENSDSDNSGAATKEYQHYSKNRRNSHRKDVPLHSHEGKMKQTLNKIDDKFPKDKKRHKESGIDRQLKTEKHFEYLSDKHKQKHKDSFKTDKTSSHKSYEERENKLMKKSEDDLQTSARNSCEKKNDKHKEGHGYSHRDDKGRNRSEDKSHKRSDKNYEKGTDFHTENKHKASDKTYHEKGDTYREKRKESHRFDEHDTHIRERQHHQEDAEGHGEFYTSTCHSRHESSSDKLQAKHESDEHISHSNKSHKHKTDSFRSDRHKSEHHRSDKHRSSDTHRADKHKGERKHNSQHSCVHSDEKDIEESKKDKHSHEESPSKQEEHKGNEHLIDSGSDKQQMSKRDKYEKYNTTAGNIKKGSIEQSYDKQNDRQNSERHRKKGDKKFEPVDTDSSEANRQDSSKQRHFSRLEDPRKYECKDSGSSKGRIEQNRESSKLKEGNERSRDKYSKHDSKTHSSFSKTAGSELERHHEANVGRRDLKKKSLKRQQSMSPSPRRSRRNSSSSSNSSEASMSRLPSVESDKSLKMYQSVTDSSSSSPESSSEDNSEPVFVKAHSHKSVKSKQKERSGDIKHSQEKYKEHSEVHKKTNYKIDEKKRDHDRRSDSSNDDIQEKDKSCEMQGKRRKKNKYHNLSESDSEDDVLDKKPKPDRFDRESHRNKEIHNDKRHIKDSHRKKSSSGSRDSKHRNKNLNFSEDKCTSESRISKHKSESKSFKRESETRSSRHKAQDSSYNSDVKVSKHSSVSQSTKHSSDSKRHCVDQNIEDSGHSTDIDDSRRMKSNFESGSKHSFMEKSKDRSKVDGKGKEQGWSHKADSRSNSESRNESIRDDNQKGRHGYIDSYKHRSERKAILEKSQSSVLDDSAKPEDDKSTESKKANSKGSNVSSDEHIARKKERNSVLDVKEKDGSRKERKHTESSNETKYSDKTERKQSKHSEGKSRDHGTSNSSSKHRVKKEEDRKKEQNDFKEKEEAGVCKKNKLNNDVTGEKHFESSGKEKSDKHSKHKSKKHKKDRERSPASSRHKKVKSEPMEFEDMLCFDNSDAVVSENVTPKSRSSEKLQKDKEGKNRDKHAKVEETTNDKYDNIKAKFKVKKKWESNTGGLGGKIEGSKRKADEHSDSPAYKKQMSEDLASLLPSTQAHYRPISKYRDIPDRHNFEVQDSSSFLSQRNTRTAVYSGKKHATVTEMHSLFDLCIKVLQDNIDYIDYVGGIPLSILKPVLEKCTAKQLYDLEDYNPHFLEESDYLWKFHCEREFRGSKPDEMESWRELYLRKMDEREQKLKSVRANISKSIAQAAPVRTTKLAFIDNVAKPPREVRRQQAKFGTSNVIMKGGDGKKKHFPAVDMISIGRAKQQMAERAQKAPMMQKTLQMMKNFKKR